MNTLKVLTTLSQCQISLSKEKFSILIGGNKTVASGAIAKKHNLYLIGIAYTATPQKLSHYTKD